MSPSILYCASPNSPKFQSWTHCDPEKCCNTGTSTKPKGTAQARYCCGTPKTLPTKARNKKKPVNREGFCSKHRTHLRKVPSVPSIECKKSAYVKNSRSCGCKSTRSSEEQSIYSITDFTDLEEELLQVVTNNICGKSRTSVDQHDSLFGAHSNIFAVCNSIVEKCKELQEKTFVNSINSRNRIYYCISPSVFQIDTATEEPSQFSKAEPKLENTEGTKDNRCNQKLKPYPEKNSQAQENNLQPRQQSSYFIIKSPPKLKICQQPCQTYYADNDQEELNDKPPVIVQETSSTEAENKEKPDDRKPCNPKSCNYFAEVPSAPSVEPKNAKSKSKEIPIDEKACNSKSCNYFWKKSSELSVEHISQPVLQKSVSIKAKEPCNTKRCTVQPRNQLVLQRRIEAKPKSKEKFIDQETCNAKSCNYFWKVPSAPSLEPVSNHSKKLDNSQPIPISSKIEKEVNIQDCDKNTLQSKRSVSDYSFSPGNQNQDNPNINFPQTEDRYYLKTEDRLSDCCKFSTEHIPTLFSPARNHNWPSKTEHDLLECCKKVNFSTHSESNVITESDDETIVAAPTTSISDIFKTIAPDCCKAHFNCPDQEGSFTNYSQEKFLLDVYRSSEEAVVVDGKRKSAFQESMTSTIIDTSITTQPKQESRNITPTGSTEKEVLNIDFMYSPTPIDEDTNKPDIPPVQINRSANIDKKESCQCKEKCSGTKQVISSAPFITKDSNNKKPGEMDKPFAENSSAPKIPDCCKSNKDTESSHPPPVAQNENKPTAKKPPVAKNAAGSPKKEQSNNLVSNKSKNENTPEAKKPTEPAVEKSPTIETKEKGCSTVMFKNTSEVKNKVVSEKAVGTATMTNDNKDKSNLLTSSKDRNDNKPLLSKSSEKKMTDCRGGENRGSGLLKRNQCDPLDCEMFATAPRKKWRKCCDTSACPINDPTTSVYKFLLKAKVCCNRKECQLAAKICDNYEPMVKVEMNTPEDDYLGDYQYHFLGTDAETAYEPIEESEPPEEDIRPVPESGIVFQLYDHDQNDDHLKESIYINPEDAPRRERRTSTVSWSVPAASEEAVEPYPDTETEVETEQDVDPELSASASAEEIVAQATAEANKFRQTPEPTKASVFGDIVRNREEKDPKELTRSRLSDDIFKSQLNTVHVAESKHRTNCCTALKNKLKRKKKIKSQKPSTSVQSDLNSPTQNSSGRSSLETDPKRRPNLGEPVEEKQQQINSILNSM